MAELIDHLSGTEDRISQGRDLRQIRV